MKRFVAVLMTLMCLCSFACAEDMNLSGLKEWIDTDVAQPISEMFAEKTLITTAAAVKVDAENDIAILSFDISAKGETVAEANKQVISRIATLSEVLGTQGISEENIWHKRYDVTSNVVHHNSRITDQTVVDGYIVDIVVCVRLTDISLVGVVIDAAMQSGAVSTHELVFEKSQASEAYSDALAKAAQQAMTKAAALAESCGMELGELVSVTEKSTSVENEARVEVAYYAK